MKRLAAAALAVGLAACSSLDQFDVPLSADGVLQGQLSHLPQNGFPPWAAGGDVSKQIENQGVKASQVTSARLTKGTISVTDPPTGHLAYLDALEIWVAAPGLEDKRIAHQEAAFKDRKQTYDLVLDDVDLKPYIAAASMTLTPKITQNSSPMQDEALHVALTLHVDLSLVK